MTKLLHDVRVALRGFRRTPGFAIAVIATLGLGIGMATAMFTTFQTVLIRRLPVRDQDRVVVMWPYRVKGSELGPPASDIRQIARTSRTLDGVAAVAHWGVGLTPSLDGERSVSLQTTYTTTNYFDLLGVRPALGRLFRPEDEAVGAPQVMVLSYRAWRSQFGGSDSVIGRQLLNPYSRKATTIIGVAPPGLDHPSGVEAWSNITLADTSIRTIAVARLKSGVTIDAARAEFFSQMIQLEPTWELKGASASTLTTVVLGDIRPILVALMAAVGLLLLIACVNVANLFLVRASARTRELSIRRAIGATRGDLIRQLATESSLLAIGGGAIGAALAALLLRGLVVLAPVQLPRLDELSLRPSVLGAVLAITVLSTLMSGLVPALIGARVNPASPLRQDARSGTETIRRRHLRDWLVASQIALAIVMLAGAGLLARSLLKLETLNLGYDTEHLSIMSVSYDPKAFPAADTTRRARIEADLIVDEQFERRVRAIPGVTAVTPLTLPPFMGAGLNVGVFEAEGQSDIDVKANPTTPWEVTGTDYFRTLGMRIIRGRGFEMSDREGAELVTVISESVAKRLWPGQDAIGKRIRFAPAAQKAGSPMPPEFVGWRRVIGIVGDTHFREFRDSSPNVYLPWRQFVGMYWGYFAFRSAGDLASTTTALRAALKELNSTYAIWSLRSFDDILAAPLAQPRLSALLLSAFGIVALLLASVGLYGVMSSLIREQTREIGIRVALGATPKLIRDTVLRRALGMSAIGAGVGFIVALVGTRFLRSLLYQVSPGDPLTLIAVAFVLLVVTLASAYPTARRATRVDPMTALRE